MDRFLALTPVPRTQLQILAAACLLLASKLREPSVRGLPADLLVFYTDNSISRRELIVSTIYLYLVQKNLNKHAINHDLIIFRFDSMKKKTLLHLSANTAISSGDV